MNCYYSNQAYQLAQWAQEENNRVKASHLMAIAQRLESKFCKSHSEYIRYTCRKDFLYSPLCNPQGKPPYGSRPLRTK